MQESSTVTLGSGVADLQTAIATGVAAYRTAAVLRHLANEFGAVGAQAVEDVVDVVDDEPEARDARGVHQRPRSNGGAAGLWT